MVTKLYFHISIPWDDLQLLSKFNLNVWCGMFFKAKIFVKN